jgi:MFS family permease
MLILGRSSDYFGERRWHLAIACAGGAIGLLMTALAPDPTVRIIGVIIATAMFIGGTPLVWALGGNFMSGRAAATGYALINAVAALGGLCVFALPSARQQNALDQAAKLHAVPSKGGAQ